jgi:hypothetical protein
MGALQRALCAAILLGAAACGGDDDSSPSADGGSGADGGPPGDSAVIFDESVIRTYELDVEAADWEWLNDNATMEMYVPATLHFEGQTVGEIGIRYKGGYGSLYTCFDSDGNRTCDKLSIKLAFDEYDEEGRFYGLKKLNFHSMEADASHMHDAIVYKLFRDQDVPAPRTAYARLLVNGELLGLFAVIEQIDGRFTRARFPDGGEGNLYKEVWPEHTTQQPYLDALETNEDEQPSADKMVRFAQALADAGEEGFAGVIDEWMDPDQLMRYMAVARLADHWDDIIAFYCAGGPPCFNHNYYWYESTSEDRVWLIAWDVDHTFEEPSPVRTYFDMPDWDEVDADCTPKDIFLGVQGRAPACDPFIRGMVTQLWDRYAAASQELLDGDFALAAMNGRIDELSDLIADAVAEDPNGPTVSAWRNAVMTLRDTVVDKRAWVEGKL